MKFLHNLARIFQIIHTKQLPQPANPFNYIHRQNVSEQTFHQPLGNTAKVANVLNWMFPDSASSYNLPLCKLEIHKVPASFKKNRKTHTCIKFPLIIYQNPPAKFDFFSFPNNRQLFSLYLPRCCCCWNKTQILPLNFREWNTAHTNGLENCVLCCVVKKWTSWRVWWCRAKRNPLLKRVGKLLRCLSLPIINYDAKHGTGGTKTDLHEKSCAYIKLKEAMRFQGYKVCFAIVCLLLDRFIACGFKYCRKWFS